MLVILDLKVTCIGKSSVYFPQVSKKSSQRLVNYQAEKPYFQFELFPVGSGN